MPLMAPARGFLTRGRDGRALRASARRATWRCLDWYIAFGYFKLAVIAEGIHHRYLQGKTVGEGFDHFGDGRAAACSTSAALP